MSRARATKLDRSLGVFFFEGARVTLAHPRQARQFLRTVRWQAAAARVRRGRLNRGLRVPPIIIFSITHQCNLQCAGCYARTFHDVGTGATPGATPGAGATACPGELSSDRLAGIVDEAADLGVSFFVIAGGEPLMRPEILDIAGCHPHALFLLLTNGLLLDRSSIARLARLRNVVPLLSLEGTAAQTDARRGAGTHQQALEAMRLLRDKRAFFGCSITLTSGNFSTVLDEDFVGDLVETGCKFFLFIDYTPADAGTEGWVLSDEQRAMVTARMAALRRRYRALFVAVPWDEQEVGGCLSAGRGFVHINASGDLEPCPFAPLSDANLNDESLAEALRSPFLRALRELPELSEYAGSGCALWKNREQVERVLTERGWLSG